MGPKFCRAHGQWVWVAHSVVYHRPLHALQDIQKSANHMRMGRVMRLDEIIISMLGHFLLVALWMFPHHSCVRMVMLCLLITKDLGHLKTSRPNLCSSNSSPVGSLWRESAGLCFIGVLSSVATWLWCCSFRKITEEFCLNSTHNFFICAWIYSLVNTRDIIETWAWLVGGLLFQN